MKLEIDSVQHGKDIGFAISVLKSIVGSKGASGEQIREAIERLENFPLVEETQND